MRCTLRTTLLPAAALSLLTAGSYASTIYMDTSNASGESWTTASCWNPDGAAVAGNDYIVGAGFILRTPHNAASASFDGDSLTIQGTLGLKTSSTGNVTINRLIIDGGSVVNYNSGNAGVVKGATITLQNDVRFTPGGSDRGITLNSSVTGSGTATITTSYLALTGTGNSFSGTWVVGSSGDLRAQSAGSLGGPGVSVQTAGTDATHTGKLNLDYDWVTTGSLTIGTYSAVTLDQKLTVGALTVDGQSYAPGTYTFAQLNGAHDAQFVNGGTGSISVVVPEPASLALMASFAAAAVASRRRRAC